MKQYLIAENYIAMLCILKADKTMIAINKNQILRMSWSMIVKTNVYAENKQIDDL